MRTVIFDFDGTIADTFYIAVDVFRKLGKGRRDTSDAAVEHLRSLPAQKVFSYLNVPWWFVPFVAYHGRKAVHHELDNIKAIGGVAPVLEELKKQGYTLLIVSSNSHSNITRFLQNNKLEQYFDKTYGGIGIFSKAAILTKIMREHHLAKTDCVYVGDEVRDQDAARKVGMPCVSVTWGYNSRAALEAAGDMRIVEKPEELLQAITAPAAK
jgi:phosphoglycolate phosphatase-like HAD superfamily hydrolase